MSASWFVIANASSFRVSGRDSRRYLHNRLSQDIRGLAPVQSAIAAALSAQGRVEGLFTVFCEGEEQFLVVADGGDGKVLEAVLKRFVVADRVSFEDISQEVSLVHLAAPQDNGQTGSLISCCKPLYVVPRARIGSSGVDLLIPTQCAQATVTSCTEQFGAPIDSESFDRMRWEAGRAVFPDEVNEQGMILEFGLREAVSFTKGCYVGQEVVERSDAIGKQPRQLERIVLSDSRLANEGSVITTPEGEVLGKVITSFVDPDNDRTLIFALLRTTKYNVGDTIVCCERRGAIV